MKAGTGKVIPGGNHVFTDIAAQVIMTHIGATLGHDTEIIATTPETVHDAHAQCTEITAIVPTMPSHIDPTRDHPHIKVLHLPLQRSK